jgi:hypothetical protein
MKRAYWFAVIFCAGFLGWAHCHTDEIPVVFGFVIIAGAILGALSPRRAVVSWALVGAPILVAEILVHYSLVHAPYPATPLKNLPLIALVVYVVAAIGVALGAGARKIAGTAAIP